MIVDETGLFPLRSRDLLAGLRSSVSARGGKIRHISIRGDSELFAEILANPACVSHVFAAPDGCEIDDESAWRAANPALGVVKSLQYMRDEVERVKGVSSDEPSFRSLDLNQRISPTGKWSAHLTICGRASSTTSPAPASASSVWISVRLAVVRLPAPTGRRLEP